MQHLSFAFAGVQLYGKDVRKVMNYVVFKYMDAVRESTWGSSLPGKVTMHDELSHALRTPLTSVLGYTATMLDRWDALDEKQRLEFLRIVYSEALRMSHSVEFIDRRLYQEFADYCGHNDGLNRELQMADVS